MKNNYEINYRHPHENEGYLCGQSTRTQNGPMNHMSKIIEVNNQSSLSDGSLSLSSSSLSSSMAALIFGLGSWLSSFPLFGFGCPKWQVPFSFASSFTFSHTASASWYLSTCVAFFFFYMSSLSFQPFMASALSPCTCNLSTFSLSAFSCSFVNSTTFL